MGFQKWNISKAILLIYFLFSALFIGDYRVRIANDAYDDSPVVYSEFYKNPQNFKEDSFYYDAKDYIFASVQNAIPALFYRHLNFPPEYFYYLFLFLQNVLLLVALSHLGKRITGEELDGVVVGSLTYFCFPWVWNLAWYPNYMQHSYPAQFVLAPLVWATCALLDRAPRKFWLWVILATLIHPSMALYMAAIGSIFLLWQDRSVKNIWPITLAIAAAWLPSFLLRDPSAKLLSREAYMANIALNGHMVSLTKVVTLGVIPFFLTLSALALFTAMKISVELKRLVASGLFFFALAVSAYFIGHTVGIPLILQLVPLRSSSLLSVIHTIIILSYFVNRIRLPNTSDRIASLITLGSLALFPKALPWAITFLPLLGERLSEKTKMKVIYVWALAFILLGRPMRWLGVESAAVQIRHMMTVGPPNSHAFTLLLLVSLSLSFVFQRYRKFSPVHSVLLLCLGLFIYHGVQGLLETLSGRKVDLFNAQKWAKYNTPAGTLFVTPQPWRGISLRPAVDPTTIWFPVYTRRQSTMDIGNQWEKFFNSRHTTPTTLSESDTIAFAEQFGGSYWVTQESSSTLPLVYRNNSYAIYALPQ